jgi:hypothetical protein
VAHGLGDHAQAVGRLRRRALMTAALSGAPGMAISSKPVRPVSSWPAPSAGFVDGAADGHRLAHRFHRGGQFGSAPGNFSKAKRGILVTT